MTKNRRQNRARLGVVALAGAATLLLAACSGGSGNGGSGGGGDDAQDATIAITPAASAQLSPNAPINVKVANGKLTNVAVTNEKGKAVKGEFSPDKTSWHTTEDLGYGATYNVDAKANGDGKNTDKKSTVHTIDPKTTAYPALIPPPGSNNSIGVGLPLVVQFDHKITDKAAAEKALQVTSTPNQEGAWHWIDDKQVDYRPKEFWKPGTKIHLHVGIYGVNLGDGVYGKADRDLDLTVHDSWIAKADANTEKMTIEHNGKAVKTMPVSMGKDDTPTHSGTHVVSSKSRSYQMNSCTYGVCSGPHAYNTTEYYAERISNDGEFVHENPASVGSQGSSNVSHGCINLNEANASWFFENFGVGDVVEVANGGGKLPVYDLYGDWSLSWDQWLKGSALHKN
ncbi:L,D-transpeptidase [Sciscionella sediminilitoris]|uniref:L,D-transpeptidase n=1 Tax=Sciscionella sediminilitoris TaxID=1445613 RepID=UPI00068A7F6F|nr:Ig-like domain-containing protein [Sciscionella sp. SE31]